MTTRIQFYQSVLMPGVLQTPGYGGWALKEWARHLPAEERQVRIEVRVGRCSTVWCSTSAVLGAFGNFVLMNLSDAEDGVLYRERFDEDQVDHDAQVILPYREAFEDLWKLSLPEDASLRLIRYVALGLRVRLDRLPAAGGDITPR